MPREARRKTKMSKKNQIAAIILAAGKGVRMRAKRVNKVAMPLGGKPMICYATELCERAGIKKIIIVVGFAKNSIKKILGDKYTFAYQKFQLGTAHALSCGLKHLPQTVEDVLVFYADHCAFYRPKEITGLIRVHKEKKSFLTFITVKSNDPFGYGRILRDTGGKVLGIVEEKNASSREKEIREINPGTYCFKVNFLKKYLPRVRKNEVTGEYYLTDLVSLGISNGVKVETLRVANPKISLGVNTLGEREYAEKIMEELKYAAA